MRLVCWRFYRFLAEHKQLDPAAESARIDWDSYKDVYGHFWKPYFGETLVNGLGRPEPTFPYVLRHTQNRPRQLVEICYAIARRAQDDQSFPKFQSADIVSVVGQAETKLAQEIINSYSQVYQNAGKIIDALMGSPMLFDGRSLDRWAPRTASQWPTDKYSPYSFRQLLSEMGVIGRVRKKDERTKIVKADFEYFVRDRLPIVDTDECAIHPMFYRRLNVAHAEGWRVYPFPDHPDYQVIEDQL